MMGGVVAEVVLGKGTPVLDRPFENLDMLEPRCFIACGSIPITPILSCPLQHLEVTPQGCMCADLCG